MIPYEPIQLTHANNKQPIYVSRELIFSYYFSQGHKSTVLLASGGAMLPVLESPETIKQLIGGNTNDGTN
jgi:hypothetical protein